MKKYFLTEETLRKFEELSEEEKEQIDGFATVEITFFKDVAQTVKELNNIILSSGRVEGGYRDSDGKYKNVFSKQDYKLFLGMKPEHIDLFVYYAKEIFRTPELVENMPQKSYIYRSNKKEERPQKQQPQQVKPQEQPQEQSQEQPKNQEQK
ncbi:MAG: hypothetical protein NZZ41_01670 [Candidatus Dojkabacteria bacterium]|nr:hypothetical protein [Candidatus Dojkabacteria bacterium]